MRLIGKVEIKPPHSIKPIQGEGLRKIGKPLKLATGLYVDGYDELMICDTSASLHRRGVPVDIVEEIADNVPLPLTAGGGIDSVEKAIRLVHSGADRVSLSSGLLTGSVTVGDIASELGSQAICLVVEVRRVRVGVWEVLHHGGREQTGKNAISWLEENNHSSIGEVLLLSLDRDGLDEGPDLELLTRARVATDAPLVYQGGIGTAEQALRVADAGADGLVITSSCQGRFLSASDLKVKLAEAGWVVRQ